jgi:phospholipid/cholesterol/gamma-HCH transport system permease protein
MSLSLFYSLGRFVLDRTTTYLQSSLILARTVVSFFKLSFLNHAVARVLVRQIYFTAIQALPAIFITALLLGSILVNYLLGVLTGLNAYDRIGEFIIFLNLYELGPIITLLTMLIRSGTAVISEIALMKLSGEIDTLTFLNIGLSDYIFLPRFMAFIISGPALNFVFCLTSLIGGFLVLGFFHNITFDNYIYQITSAISIKDLMILFIKPIVMSTVLISICLQKGISVQQSFTEVPVKLIQGLMHTIGLVVVIEIIFALI